MWGVSQIYVDKHPPESSVFLDFACQIIKLEGLQVIWSHALGMYVSSSHVSYLLRDGIEQSSPVSLKAMISE